MGSYAGLTVETNKNVIHKREFHKKKKRNSICNMFNKTLFVSLIDRHEARGDSILLVWRNMSILLFPANEVALSTHCWNKVTEIHKITHTLTVSFFFRIQKSISKTVGIFFLQFKLKTVISDDAYDIFWGYFKDDFK